MNEQTKKLSENHQDLLENWPMGLAKLLNTMALTGEQKIDNLRLIFWKEFIEKLLQAKDFEAEIKVKEAAMAEREKIIGELRNNVQPLIIQAKEYFVLLRDLDDQYQQDFLKMAYNVEQALMFMIKFPKD